MPQDPELSRNSSTISLLPPLPFTLLFIPDLPLITLTLLPSLHSALASLFPRMSSLLQIRNSLVPRMSLGTLAPRACSGPMSASSMIFVTGNNPLPETLTPIIRPENAKMTCAGAMYRCRNVGDPRCCLRNCSWMKCERVQQVFQKRHFTKSPHQTSHGAGQKGMKRIHKGWKNGILLCWCFGRGAEMRIKTWRKRGTQDRGGCMILASLFYRWEVILPI